MIKQNTSDYFDSIEIGPTIAVMLILTLLGYGFIQVLEKIQITPESKNTPETLFVEEEEREIPIESFTEGKVVDEQLRAIIEGEGKTAEKEIDEVIRALIEKERKNKNPAKPN